MSHASPTKALNQDENHSSQPRLERLQLLRGIAALLIVLFHATQLSYQKFDQLFLLGLFRFGDAGVEFFFVLSGFILFFVHQKDINHRSRALPFLLKRLIRIYPFYWVLTLAILPVYFVMPSFGGGYERDWDVILKSLLLFPQEQGPILVVAWFLSHIVFFYLLFSVAIALPPQQSKPLFWAGILATLGFAIAGRFLPQAIQDHTLLKFVLSPYNLSFLGGCWAAYWFRQHLMRRAAGNVLLTVGSTAFILLGIYHAYWVTALTTPDSIVAYSGFAMLMVIGAATLDRNLPIRLNWAVLLLGEASYSIYLTHYALFSVLFKLIAPMELRSLALQTAIGVTVLIAIGVGFGVHLYLEKPIAAMAKRLIMGDPRITVK